MFKLDHALLGRSLLNIRSLSDAELAYMVDLAIALKARRKAGIRGELLHRKNIALIFEKSSTRTRNSAAIAVRDEGGHAEFLTGHDTHFGVKESVADSARVLGRLFDGILFRGFAQQCGNLGCTFGRAGVEWSHGRKPPDAILGRHDDDARSLRRSAR